MTGNLLHCGILLWGKYKMYIINHEAVSSHYACKKAIADALMSRGFPLLSRNGNTFYFANTRKLHDELDNIGIITKLIDKLL